MKFFKAIYKAISRLVFLVFSAIVATFFIAIFNPDGVQKAVEIFKNLFVG